VRQRLTTRRDFGSHPVPVNIMRANNPSKTLFLTYSIAIAATLATACVETEDVAPAAKSFAPDPSTTYTLVGVQSGKCVEVTEAEPRALQIRNCATSRRNRFKLEPVGGGFYKIHNVETNLCVDIDGQSRADAARLMARPCGDGASQQWSLPEAAPGVVKVNSRHSGKSMDVFATNTADGTNLIQWIPHDQPNQQFRVQVAPAGPLPPLEPAKPAGPVAIGFAAVDGTVTGGGDGAPTVATNVEEATKALTGPAPRVVRLSGTITGTLSVGANKTVEGAPDAVLRGRLEINGGSSNVLVRNLKIVGDSCAKRPGCVADNDAAIAISGRAHHVWIDHCDLSNGGTADLVVTEGADNVTVSWTKLSHSGAAKGKRMGALIGMGKNDKGADGHLRVTFHHDWWAPSLDGAMPRVRFGQVHVFDSYYNAAKNKTGIEAAADAKLVLENNAFQGVAKPHGLLAPSAQIAARGNAYDATVTGSKEARGAGFNPPYAFKLDDAAAVAAMVKAEAGPPHPAPAPSAPAAKK